MNDQQYSVSASYADQSKGACPVQKSSQQPDGLKRMSQVEMQMHQLDQSTQTLRKRLVELMGRFASLRREATEAAASAIERPDEPLVPHADRLRSINRTVQFSHEIISELESTLEL